MGTIIYFDEMLPATDAEARKNPAAQRQLEILTPSGEHEIHLRLGRLNSQNDGNGYTVKLDQVTVQKFREALEQAADRLQYRESPADR
jgi:hypothetical protein